MCGLAKWGPRMIDQHGRGACLDADDVVSLLEDAELLLHLARLLRDLQLIGQVGVPAMVHNAVHTWTDTQHRDQYN